VDWGGPNHRTGLDSAGQRASNDGATGVGIPQPPTGGGVEVDAGPVGGVPRGPSRGNTTSLLAGLAGKPCWGTSNTTLGSRCSSSARTPGMLASTPPAREAHLVTIAQPDRHRLNRFSCPKSRSTTSTYKFVAHLPGRTDR
jgi:hypothetical protein